MVLSYLIFLAVVGGLAGQETVPAASVPPAMQVGTAWQDDASAQAGAPAGTPPVPLPTAIAPTPYPADALRTGKEGDVELTLTVSKNGSVQQCAVSVSSGTASLDAASCATMRHLRFAPARSREGKAVQGNFSTHVRWKLPR